MDAARDAVEGREAELAAVEELLGRVSSGPAALVLEGEAGIGKTTVWRAGLRAARDRAFTVLACRPTAAEIRLSHAGLSDLLDEVAADRFEQLSPPQRRALDAALLRSSDDAASPDPRAVAAGFLSLLDGLAETAPTLLAIDDLQWLDDPSLRVVEFAVRRCRGPIGVLVTQRTGSADGLRPRDPSRSRVLALEPLRRGALYRLLRRRAATKALPRSALARVAEACGGNPFFALELVRDLDDRPSGPVTLPDNLQAAVQDRLGRLDPPVLDALGIVAALSSPRVDVVDRALGDGDAAIDLLDVAEDRGVIELASDGSVRFSHPLLAAGVAAMASPSARRAIHRRLSGLVDDPEEQARHRAFAAVGPEPETVRMLDVAAAHARRRGAPAASAELLELAIGLGADDPQRSVAAAQDRFNAGDPLHARQLLEPAVAALDVGPARARALAQLGTIRFEIDGDREAAGLLEQAISEARGEPTLRCSIRVDACFVLFVSGHIDDSLRHAAAAIEEAEAAGDDGLFAEALAASAIVQFLSGAGIDDVSLTRALELEDVERRTAVRRWPSTVAAQLYRWTHRLDEAQEAFGLLRTRCLDRGAESDLWFVSLGAIPAACWAGDTAGARWLVDDAIDRAQAVESEHALAMARLFEAQLAAWVGDVGRARRAAAEATTLFAIGQVSTIALEAPAAAGMGELSLGDPAAAQRHLDPAVKAALEMGFVEPASAGFLPDAVEALVATDRVDEAEPLVELLEASARSPDRTWAEAIAARCRGLLLAGRGRSDDALAEFERALAVHDRLPQLRYDRARTLLALGAAQRRRKRRRAAAASLEEAATLFEEVGASAWARLARTEIERLGLRRDAGDDLTPTEQSVAELAAAGQTNRDVAAALFMSPKTVEAHLTRVYRKLEIHSRAELGWRMAERSQER